MALRGSLSASVRAFRERLDDDALRKAAGAGAKVLYDEIHVRVPVDEGLLRSAVYRYYDKARSVAGRHTYSIGVNKKKAPHWHLLEFGHWLVNVTTRLPNGQIIATKERLPVPKWIPAVPYLRPSFDGRVSAAMDAARSELAQSLRNGGRDGD